MLRGIIAKLRRDGLSPKLVTAPDQPLGILRL
jgi:hypothetical protein